MKLRGIDSGGMTTYCEPSTPQWVNKIPRKKCIFSNMFAKPILQFKTGPEICSRKGFSLWDSSTCFSQNLSAHNTWG